jgi:ABC-type transport system substrate-binding protein
MKKLLLLPAILLLVPLAGFSCQSSIETTSTTFTATAPPEQPVYGGTLRFITSGGPQMLAYPPLMSPTDTLWIFAGVERLVDYSDDRDKEPYEPVLAESMDDDIANKRMVFHLRPGVKFHDGSDLDADVVIWNFERYFDGGDASVRRLLGGHQKARRYDGRNRLHGI